MLFLAQSAAFFLILYKLPVLGSAGTESKLAVAAASSVLASSALTLILDAIAAPSRIHGRIMECLRKQHVVIMQAFGSEAKIRLLATLHNEGLQLYRTVRPVEEYYATMNDWVKRTKAVLVKAASASDVFRFGYSQYGNLEYAFTEETDREWASETYAKRR